MITRLKEWFRFDAEALTDTASALAGLSGAPLPLFDLRTDQKAHEESAEPAVATTVGG